MRPSTAVPTKPGDCSDADREKAPCRIPSSSQTALPINVSLAASSVITAMEGKNASSGYGGYRSGSSTSSPVITAKQVFHDYVRHFL